MWNLLKQFGITKKSYYNWLNVMHHLLYGDTLKLRAPEFEIFDEKAVEKPNHYTKAITRLKYRNKFLDKNNS